MHKTLKTAWPLFAGLILLMIGNGLQGTLLGVRATMEDFGTVTTGIIMSLYYGGYLAGSVLAPRLIAGVGHIRVFAAMASLASTTSLLHGIFVDPVAWALVRVMTGFVFAALYIVIESWMNDISTKETRGKILASYLVAFYGAMVGGQYLMTVAPPENIELFVLCSILTSVALLPIALLNRPAPAFHAPVRIGLRQLWKASPLGVFGVALSGFGGGMLFSIGPVFGMMNGLSVANVANFMTLYILGGMLAQIPLGMLSDRMDRRKVIVMVAGLASLAAFLCWLVMDNTALLFTCFFAFGMLALVVYPVSSAYTNDRLEKDQYVAASAALILVNGAAAFAGPFIVSLLMDAYGHQAFFLALTAVFAVIALFGLYRSFRTPAVKPQSHTDLTPAPLPAREQA